MLVLLVIFMVTAPMTVLKSTYLRQIIVQLNPKSYGNDW